MLPVSEKAEVISITEMMHEACVSTQWVRDNLWE